jgi:hypothetical protein
LSGRMRQYRLGDPRQRTSFRINGRIRLALESNQVLKVLFATPNHSGWNGLPVSTASGLEVGLIQAIRPEWNIHIENDRAPTCQSVIQPRAQHPPNDKAQSPHLLRIAIRTQKKHQRTSICRVPSRKAMVVTRSAR